MTVTKVARCTKKSVSSSMPPMEAGKPYEVRYEGKDGKEEVVKGACVKIGGPSMTVTIRCGEDKTEIPYDNIMDVVPQPHVVEPMPKAVETALAREGVTAEGEVLRADFEEQYNHGKRVGVANKINSTAKDKTVKVTFCVSVEIPFSVTSNMIVDAAEKLNIPAVKCLEFIRMEKVQ